MGIVYENGGKIAVFDGAKYTRDDKTGYYLAAKKDEHGKRERLHRAVWKKANGEIPNGCEIHHKRGKDHNEPCDLELMTSEEHRRCHARNITDETRERLRANCAKIRPLAAEWHRSEAGRAWHSENAKKAWEKVEPHDEVCDNCGKVFQTRNHNRAGNKFCSNNCKSAFRRKSGVDNEIRKCEWCGSEYAANKYSRNKYCSRKCAGFAREKNRKA